mmetsp:Transcript_9541/g.14099  ORF Transcript_9541/g.14099 Transcript_9541/m.14099 type:complete len:200 (-) Transcript_9541:8-607(-)
MSIQPVAFTDIESPTLIKTPSKKNKSTVVEDEKIQPSSPTTLAIKKMIECDSDGEGDSDDEFDKGIRQHWSEHLKDQSDSDVLPLEDSNYDVSQIVEHFDMNLINHSASISALQSAIDRLDVNTLHHHEADFYTTKPRTPAPRVVDWEYTKQFMYVHGYLKMFYENELDQHKRIEMKRAVVAKADALEREKQSLFQKNQ